MFTCLDNTGVWAGMNANEPLLQINTCSAIVGDREETGYFKHNEKYKERKKRKTGHLLIGNSETKLIKGFKVMER